MRRVLTNNHWRPFLLAYDVPPAIYDWYHWLDQNEKADGWIHYQNMWLHVSDFVQLEDHVGGAWEGAAILSAFEAVLIQLSEDGERYKIGRYLT